MRQSVTRLALMMGALLLGMLPISPSGEAAEAPGLASFAYSCSGSTAESHYACQAYETERGRLARIEAAEQYIIVLPMNDEEWTALSQLIDEYLAEWDGFDGREDSGMIACDGDAFSLSVNYTDGAGLSAYGENLFPDGYAEGCDAVRRFFDALMRAWDVEVP